MVSVGTRVVDCMADARSHGVGGCTTLNGEAEGRPAAVAADGTALGEDVREGGAWR